MREYHLSSYAKHAYALNFITANAGCPYSSSKQLLPSVRSAASLETFTMCFLSENAASNLSCSSDFLNHIIVISQVKQNSLQLMLS